jgi:hypothetical protein
VAGLDDESSPAQRLGTEVHNAIKEYHLRNWVMTHKLDPNMGAYNSVLSEEAYKLVAVYTSNVEASLVDKVEHEFLIPVENIANGEKLPIKLHGFIDGITTKTHWLHEHKTSSNYWKLEDADTNIQATAYAYAYFMETGIVPEGIRFNILKKNKIDCKYQSLETYRTMEDFVYFFNWVRKTLVEITNSEFLPKQTRFNSHHRLCPLHINKRLDNE